MGEKSQFKLIGVRPLKGCAPHIRKILKEDTTYFIYNEYEVNPENPEQIKRREGVDPIHKMFFSEKKDSPLISISAIVGKNGDGKSTIVELVLRIINNFALAAGFRSAQDGLVAVKDLCAILFFSIDNEVYFIKSNDNIIKTNVFDETLELDTNSPMDNSDYSKSNQEKLFYTIITNFSIYAYNSRELMFENEDNEHCWIDGVFHKNDSYQTPVVINPMRTEGNFDINTEKHLIKQRLISLYAYDETGDKIRILNNKLIAQYLLLKPYENSKLYLTTYKSYFDKCKDINLMGSVIEDIKKNAQFVSETNYEYMVTQHLQKLIDLKNIVESNHQDFIFALKVIKTLSYLDNRSNLLDDTEKEKEISDFKEYLIEFKKTFTTYSSNINIKTDSISIKKILDYFAENEIDTFNILQIQRIILVIAIRRLWNDEINGEFNENEIYGEGNVSMAKQYIIYKTISIFTKYPVYKNIESVSILDSFNSIFNFSSRIDKYKEQQKECFNVLQSDINENKSHITLKIRQAINFININLNDFYSGINQNQNNISFTIGRIIYNHNVQSYLIDFDSFSQQLKRYIKQKKDLVINELIDFELLPPPIFQTEIIYKVRGSDKEFFSFSMLSSGEQQLLNATSSVIYHLQNINSVPEYDNLVRYEHINLIYEEVELYFHPEFQRQYIDYLITQIQKANLSKIKSINICFVTHSPFILSDIPKNNVLFLQKGRPTRQMQEDTFGGNIHTLLQNGFFLDSAPVGEFAKKKINSLFARLLSGNSSFEDGTKEEFYNQILLVSEPFIKSQLLKLYHELKPNNILWMERQLILLNAEIEILKEKLNDKD